MPVPPADTTGAWLRSRPPIHGTPVPTDSSDLTPGGEPMRKRSLIRPQTRPPSVRALPPSPSPLPPLPAPSSVPGGATRSPREDHAAHAYGRTQAERPATAAEIDASIRRTSAPPPMRGPAVPDVFPPLRGPAIPDARTEVMSQPPRPARPPLPPPDDEADTHLDLRAIPPEFIASMLAERGSGDLIADLALSGTPSWKPVRPLERPPPPEVPAELRGMADPTIDEALLELSPADEVLLDLDPRSSPEVDALASPLASAAWLEPEHSLTETPTAPLRTPIAPPSAWAQNPTPVVDQFSRTGSDGLDGGATPRAARPGAAAPSTTPRSRSPSLSGLVDPTLRDPPRDEPARPRTSGATTGRPDEMLPARPRSAVASPPPLRGASVPGTPPGGSGSPARGSSLGATPPSSSSPVPRGAPSPPASTVPRGAGAPPPSKSPVPRGPTAAPTSKTPLPRGTSAARDDTGSIRRVEDPSLDDIIQGYLDTKRRR